MSALRRLDEPCPTCERVSGDHTLREWSACIGEATTDLPFEPVAPDLQDAADTALHQRFGIDPDIVIADHVDVKAITVDGHTGPVQVRFPALLHDFKVGRPPGPPAPLAKVLYLGDVTVMRQYGRLIRDSANGAANAAERGREHG